MAERKSLIADARRFSWPWRIWFWILMLVNVLAPLFFIRSTEAQAVIGAYLVSAVTIVVVHKRIGWRRILGVGHFPWLLLLPWLAVEVLTSPPSGSLAVFVGTVLVVDGICLLIDVSDIARYLAGDRGLVVG